MKKIIAIFAVLLLVFSALSFSAFAEISPVGDKKVKVEITNNIDEDDKTISYEVKGDKLEISVNEDYIEEGYKFVKWVIKGKYEIISGSLTSKTLVIKPLGDVFLTQIFDIEALEDEDEPDKEDSKKPEGEKNESDTSPETSDNSMLGLIACALAVSAITLKVSKKSI